ncbi:YbhN family protein [Alloscardovia venturai]|uniref:YbhN family protein n=1 Tax=Alloscardovia venturai TaxID=1769421 RepID=A0ABW2Y4X3_9BIFI
MDVQVTDVQPKRAHDISDITNAVVALLAAIAVVLISLYLHGLTRGVEQDAHTVGDVVNDWLFAVPLSFLQQATMIVITIAVVAQLLAKREWLQTTISIAAFILGMVGAIAVSQMITAIHYRPLIESIKSASNVQFLLPELFAGITAFLTCAGPRRMSKTVAWCWNGMLCVAAILVMLSANSLVGMLTSILLGRCIGLVIRYGAGAPNVGVWGYDIVETARSVGLNPQSLAFIGNSHARLSSYSIDDDVTFNSRRYALTTTDGTHYTVSIADSQSHSVSYLRQLWQWILLTDLPLRRDRSVEDITHHHMLMLLAVRNAGIDAIKPYAVAERNESSLLFLEENTTLSHAELSEITAHDVASICEYLSRAHARGITHRHISANSLARTRDGHLIIAGWENGDTSSSATNIAVDRIQLLTLLSMKLGIEETITQARQVWSDDTLSKLAPFIQKVVIPSSVRDLPQWNRSFINDLRSALAALAQDDEADNVEVVQLSRFNLRTFISSLLVVVALVVILTQLNLHSVITSVETANPWFAALSLVAGCASWIGSALTLGSYTDKDKRYIPGIFVSQIAQSFAAVSMPAGVGPAFVNLRFLRKSGHKSTAATAAMSAVVAVQFATTFVVMVLLGLFTGNNGLTKMLPTGTLAIVIAVLVLIITLSMIIPPIRKLILTKLLPVVKNYARQLALLLTQPGRLTIAAAGSVFQNLMLGLSFWAALHAFGSSAGYIETTFIFLVANTLGSAAPTPGGLGGVETTLTVAFTGVGIPSAVALSATLLFRVMTYWLRIPMGALAMHWMGKKNLI